MEEWLIWMISGGVMILLELIIPGAITIFVGLAALLVGAGIKLGYLTDTTSIITAFIVGVLFFLIVIRTFFLRFYKGNTSIQNVDEQEEWKGSIVTVDEDIEPYKDGRIHYRGTTWQARSDAAILKNAKAIIVRLDGNTFIVKPIEE
jgi:membrane protein implicated in regulation of membrane protease activity